MVPPGCKPSATPCQGTSVFPGQPTEDSMKQRKRVTNPTPNLRRKAHNIHLPHFQSCSPRREVTPLELLFRAVLTLHIFPIIILVSTRPFLFGIGAFILLRYMAFLDTQKMLKPPSRPGQLVGAFQPLATGWTPSSPSLPGLWGSSRKLQPVVAPPQTALYKAGSGQFDGHAVRQRLQHAVPAGSLPCDGSAVTQLPSWPEVPLSHCRHMQCPVTR